MTIPFAGNLDALSRWRAALRVRFNEFSQFLVEHDLSDAAADEVAATLRQRLASDKLSLAFVAEFSRGKSELINAVFFADTGRRILPASPGRTTMCPVELGFDVDQPPSLALLPIETRRAGTTLAELRAQSEAWTRVPLMGRAGDQLAEAMAQVTRTQWVTQDEARTLGFWDDARPDDNPPLDERGRVEVPLWRHALVNYPHPLLQRGLVVIDTPGLNALGAEPELSLGLLPEVDATVFVLAADAGVTRSDLALWRDHLGKPSRAHFVVLNKIDTLRDPLLPPAEVAGQIEAQRLAAAVTLGVDPRNTFVLSAREGLAARLSGDARELLSSRLLEFEQALATRLLEQRHLLLQRAVNDAAHHVQVRALHRLGERRRQIAEQSVELRGLRGKSAARLRAARQRVDAEAAEFEACVVQVQALRAVHQRLLKTALGALSGDHLRTEVSRLRQAMQASLLNLGARKAFTDMCTRLRGLLATAQADGEEIHAMLGASYARLNAEFGFGLTLAAPPVLQRFALELDLIETGYVRFLGLTQALRLSQPRFMEQFQRMLISKLRVVFESASGEVELWNKAVVAQFDSQLGERRRSFGSRHLALERVQSATDELEQRIAELDTQDANLQQQVLRVGEFVESLRNAMPPQPEAGPPPAGAALPVASGVASLLRHAHA